jgi:hypothetical protein
MVLLRHLLLVTLSWATVIDLPAQSKRAKRVGPAAYSPGGPCDTSAWKLVFHDEFDGPALDRSKWVTYFTYSDDGSDRCQGCRIMGTSNTVFRDDLVTVRDGKLMLGVEARPEEWYGQRKEHAGGMVHSIGEAHFSHGRFEVRCRIPQGAGLWPAFWGFGGETEIDVFEFCGERTKWMKGSLHRWGKTKYSHTGKHRSVDLSADFHDYAVEWDGDAVRWYLDGRLVHSRARYVDRKGRPLPACDRAPGELATAPYFPRATDGINLILDLAVSEPKGYCNGPKVPVAWPADAVFEVDHVRVYQRQPEPHLRDLCGEARQIATVPPGAAPPAAGTGRRFVLTGPAAKVEWTTSSGMEIMASEGNTVDVAVLPYARGPQWIEASVPGEACSSGVRRVRTTVAIAR